MAKRRRLTDEKAIAKRISEGRGQGRGADYKPWLQIQDVPSRGFVSRVKGWKIPRIFHFLSNLELSYFYALEWSPVVIDIREQYPLLPLEETLAIAEQQVIRHPMDPKTQTPIVMTTDFFITVQQNIGEMYQARTVKPAQELQSERTLEKLEIERLYWKDKNIDWGIVTEHEIPKALVDNVKWLHCFHDMHDLSPLSEHEIHRIATALTLRISKDDAPLTHITAECEDRLGLEQGVGLSVARYLIANRYWHIDMTVPIQPRKKLNLLSTPSVGSYPLVGEVG